jgi:hypothetical protein
MEEAGVPGENHRPWEAWPFATFIIQIQILYCKGRCDRMVVGFITTHAISAYHHTLTLLA